MGGEVKGGVDPKIYILPQKNVQFVTPLIQFHILFIL